MLQTPLFFKDPYYSVWSLLNETRDAILKMRETEMAPLGITGVQSRVLFVLQSVDDPITPADLSQWLFRESQSVSALLTRMEKQGLIKKARDLERKNRIRIVITEKGRQVYKQAIQRRSIQQIISSLSEEECNQLKSYLLTLKNKAIEELAIVHKDSYLRRNKVSG